MTSGRRRPASLLAVCATAAALVAPPTSSAPLTARAAATLTRTPASGYAKKLAKDLSVDLSAIAGSGPGGRVVARDVEQAAAAPASAAPAVANGAAAAALASRFGAVSEDAVRAALATLSQAVGVEAGASKPAYDATLGSVEMTGMQKAIAKNMEATLDVPVFRVSKQIATDAFDALYRKLKPEGVTVSALLAKAVAATLADHPLMNAKYGAGTIDYNANVNVAQAVALDGGLITPTLQNADTTSLKDLSANWKDLVARAKTGGLKPDEYQSGTFTISNLGMMAVDKFAAILPPGQGAILAVASAAPQIVHVPNALMGMGVEKRMTVTLTCDHRIISGADAALFLKDLQAKIEDPAGLAK